MTLRADEIRLIMSPSEMKVRRGPHREQEKKKKNSVRGALGERKEKDKQRRWRERGNESVEARKGRKKYLRTPEEEEHLHSSNSLPPSFP